MSTGRLTRLVAFDKPTTTPDGYGGQETGWSGEFDEVKAWAEFIYLRGSEAVLAARLEGRQPIVVRVANFAGGRQITAGWRMRDLHNGEWTTGDEWDGDVFNVRTAPTPTQDRQWLEILVESGVAV